MSTNPRPVSSSSKPSGAWQPPTLEEMQAMLPQYQFISLLGRGGMGAVYKAVQVSLDRPVAIKVLPGDLVMDEDSQFAERFKNEARTMARMNHPSIVNVFDFGETQTGLLYIVMEFINGTDVAQLILSQGRLTPEYALAITEHVCDALNYAHRNGVVHRDIKPANILINMEGAVKVADFGLAKANDAAVSGGLTKTNMAMGTPDFVAPEAFIPGFSLDGRADLYAIGVMLYQMLTGEVPRGMWTMPSQRIGSDPRFDAVIAKAMQTDRELRYQTASEIHQDLHSILTTPQGIPQQPAPAAAAPASAPRPATGRPRGPSKPAPEPEPLPPKKSGGGMIYGIAAAVVVMGMGALIFSKKTPPPVPTEAPIMQTPPEPVVMPEVKPEPIAATPPPAATPAMTEAAPAPAPVPATEMVATVKPASPAPEMAAPTVTPPPATAPAPIDPEAEKRAALLAAHPRLKQLETGFQNKLETDALKTYRTAVANLNQSYLTKGIPARRREAQAKGNLAEVTALDAETALIKGGGSVPAEDSADTPAVLVALHQAYRGAEAAFAKTRDEKAAPVYAIYVKALDAYIAELTQTNKIADAQQVKALRDEIATKKPEINAPAPPAAKGSPKALATAPPKPTTSTGNSWRVAAEYLTKYGGFCTVMKNGARIDIRTAADIPVGRFDITELHLDHLSGTFPSPKAADFQAFNGLRDLQRVWVRLPNSTLPDSAYVWLVGNEELNWINFESGGDLTDEVLINLSSAKKLDFLQVNYAPRFTGAGLERMPFAATLTGGNFLGTSFNDDGLRGFASYKKLSFLRITGTKVTDSGFAALAGVKSLTNLDAEQTGFGNEAAAAIATLPSLSTLNLNSTQITDKGLEKLSALKNLTSLSLSNTKVSAEAAGTFQIAHPECRVSR